jgi:non-specific serine/threonine protein kinase/serine/threonine-protein kinase
MNPGRWQKVTEIVAGARELNHGQRLAYVERVCGGDAELRQNVESLLSADDPDSPVPDIDRLPARIGAYRIVCEIGRGSTGAFYLGERDDGQFEQRSAIKVIQRGMDSGAARRFRDEWRTLARLQHPNIARLFDGGMLEGRPYFAMEYIEGEPIVEYANRLQLSLKARIHLFLRICDAVEYAHCNLILHRDIRAGNILVDSAGAPKLLDFGIARLLEEDDAGQSALVQSSLGQSAITPQSASPEQVRGEPPTTASDVYALGLLLFELLAGEPAYRLQTGSMDEMSRVVCEEPPPRPSTLADAPAARVLKGDLDSIVLKALEKEPAQRYRRADDLAADLRRYLQRLPVHARPGGMLYRASKFAVRHRVSMAIAAVVLLAIGLAAGGAIRQGRRAQRRFDDLRQFAGAFLFEFHGAIANLPGATPARELVVKRTLQYLDRLSREASNDAKLKRELAEWYLRVGDAQGLAYESNLGKPAEARASYQKAVALLSDIARAAPSDARAQSDLARARNHLASAMAETGDVNAAFNMLQQVASAMESLSRKQPLDAPARFNLGRTYFGIAEYQRLTNHTAEALQARLRSIEIFRDLAAQDANNHEALRWYATSEMRLASFYLLQLHDSAKAAASLDIAVNIDRRRVAQNPGDAMAKLDLTLGQSYMAALLQGKGELPAAQRLYETTIAVRKELLAADPGNYRLRYLLATDYGHLGDLLRLEQHADGARRVYREGLATAMPLEPKAATDPDATRTIGELRKKAVE